MRAGVCVAVLLVLLVATGASQASGVSKADRARLAKVCERETERDCVCERERD